MKTLETLKRVYVSFGNKGFTMSEALVGLAAFCLMAAILPISINLFSTVEQINPRLQAMQMQVFTSQIKKEVRMSQIIDPQSSRLFLKKDSDTIIYELSGTNVRRRVNFSGNEILLQNVNKLQFEPIRNGVIVKVEDSWNKKYAFSIRSFIDLGN
jgi:competence protein ComGF